VYNEDWELINKSVTGITKNMPHFHDAGVRSEDFGVVILFDGIDVVNPNVIENLSKRLEYRGIRVEEEFQEIKRNSEMLQKQHPNLDMKTLAVCYQGKIALNDFADNPLQKETNIKKGNNEPTSVFFVFKLGNGGKLH
jgi:hypothetical protein